jgi:hypothetical protein
LNGGAPGASNFRAGGWANTLEHAGNAIEKTNIILNIKMSVVSSIGEFR